MNNLSGKRAFVTGAGAAALAVLLFSAAPSAAGEINTGYFGDVAIKGYDPVAYFTDARAVKGSANISYRWLDATWHFASAEHRDMFAKDPVKFAPQYGGHCADGVSLGTITTNIDPRAWRIIDGKLYLNYDPGAASGFAEAPDKVKNSAAHWADVRAMLMTAKPSPQ